MIHQDIFEKRSRTFMRYYLIDLTLETYGKYMCLTCKKRNKDQFREKALGKKLYNNNNTIFI